jgi:hypothetical protein
MKLENSSWQAHSLIRGSFVVAMALQTDSMEYIGLYFPWPQYQLFATSQFLWFHN